MSCAGPWNNFLGILIKENCKAANNKKKIKSNNLIRNHKNINLVRKKINKIKFVLTDKILSPLKLLLKAIE